MKIHVMGNTVSSYTEGILDLFRFSAQVKSDAEEFVNQLNDSSRQEKPTLDLAKYHDLVFNIDGKIISLLRSILSNFVGKDNGSGAEIHLNYCLSSDFSITLIRRILMEALKGCNTS